MYCLVFHTSGGISLSPAAFLFLIFLRTESSSLLNGPSLMSNCLLGSITQQDANCLDTYHLSRKLYKLDEADMLDTAGEAKTRSEVMCSCGPLHMANQKQDDQFEHTYSSYVMMRDVTLTTCRRRWMIGRRGERGSEISVLAARHDDDDDEPMYGI